MNKQILKGFNNEMQKEALLPVWAVKKLTRYKVWKASRLGEKSIYREAGRIASEAARTGGKDVGAGSYMDELVAAMKKTRVPGGVDTIKSVVTNPETAKSVSGAKGFLSRNKGKLLLGGAGAAGLYLASKPNEQDEQQRKARLAMRNMNIPQSVYYQ